MAYDTYPALQAYIVRTAIRTGDPEFTAEVPNFISDAEVRFNRTLRIAGMEKTVTLSPDAFGAVILPDDYLEYRSVNPGVSGYGEMEMVDPGSQVGDYQGGGVGRRFSISGNVLQTYPAAGNGVILTYFARVPALSDANPTNWLLTLAPDLYRYGALLEAAPYMEEDARAATWKQYYDAAFNDLTSADTRARYATGRIRVYGDTP
jgi:hypothetical protein